MHEEEKEESKGGQRKKGVEEVGPGGLEEPKKEGVAGATQRGGDIGAFFQHEM